MYRTDILNPLHVNNNLLQPDTWLDNDILLIRGQVMTLEQPLVVTLALLSKN